MTSEPQSSQEGTDQLEDLVAVTGNFPGGVRAYNYITGEERFRLGNESGHPLCLFNDGILLHGNGIKTSGGFVQTFDIRRRALVGTLRGGRGSVWGLAASEYLELVATSGFVKDVHVWKVDPANVQSSSFKCKLEGHTSSVVGLCMIETRGWLCSGSLDKTARLWDANQEVEVKKLDVGRTDATIWDDNRNTCLLAGQGLREYSLRNFKRVRTFRGGPVCLTSSVLSHRDNAVYVGTFPKLSRIQKTHHREKGGNSGVVAMFDRRNEAKPIWSREFHKKDVWSIVHPDRETFITSSPDKSTKVWKSDFKTIHTWNFAGGCYGACHLGDEGSESSHPPLAPQEAVEVLTDLLSFKIACASGAGEITASKCLLGESSLVGHSSDNVSLLGTTRLISNDGFIGAILGDASRIPPKELHDFYCLFDSLNLMKHAYLACKEVEKLEDLSVLVSLIRMSFPLGSFKALESEEGSGSLSQLLSELSPFVVSLLLQLRKLNGSFDARTGMSLSLAGVLFLVDQGSAELASLRPLHEHPLFADLRPPPKSFPHLFQETCSRLFESRDFSNVTLKTKDGHSEKAHVEVLVARSAFFLKMLKFGGVERNDFKTTSEILIEDFDSQSLPVLLTWLYIHDLPDVNELSFQVLLRLFVHARMFDDQELIRRVKRGLMVWVNHQSSDAVLVSHLEVGWMLMDLSDEDREWFVKYCGARHPSGVFSYDGHILFSRKVHDASLKCSCGVMDRLLKKKRDREEDDEGDDSRDRADGGEGDHGDDENGGWSSRLRKRRKKD